MNKGKIIILNGVSSSGKTTLAKALQNCLKEEYIYISSDEFMEMLPGKMLRRNKLEALYKREEILVRMAKMLSEMGLNVIVDDVITTWSPVFEYYLDLLHEYPVLLVKVECPLPELRRRELVRGDRERGLAERQLTQLVPQEGYDVTVNTFEHTVIACAEIIAERLTDAGGGSAMERLRRQRAEKKEL